ncbi:uncharacterized protein A1O9_10307 [Exophiala aquamarina CBS 119918]|uniref:EthD domain-containing protein n=1 Tax=Exophiala aquamarina CBS 119918 TaxID=1182545 RepID=A0A072PEC6_9EURO|nr:uncharacterized protein A1O9_10307 [Exophiala aquamarina CBS 119918]KEF53905.1 hypothetical protein A1O9_10307 [Exophiala aquamarina CBS 119918]
MAIKTASLQEQQGLWHWPIDTGLTPRTFSTFTINSSFALRVWGEGLSGAWGVREIRVLGHLRGKVDGPRDGTVFPSHSFAESSVLYSPAPDAYVPKVTLSFTVFGSLVSQPSHVIAKGYSHFGAGNQEGGGFGRPISQALGQQACTVGARTVNPSRDRQYHITPEHKALVAAIGSKSPYDGIAEFLVHRYEDMLAFFADPEYMEKIRPDEEAVGDNSKMICLVGVDYVVIDGNKYIKHEGPSAF